MDSLEGLAWPEEEQWNNRWGNGNEALVGWRGWPLLDWAKRVVEFALGIKILVAIEFLLI